MNLDIVELVGIESVPPLCDKVCREWGSERLDNFIERLLTGSDETSRQTLPAAIVEELQFLSSIAKLLADPDILKPTALPVSVPADPAERAGIETLPRLCEKICLTWATAELDIFISRLIMDSRDGGRAGLPVDAAAELLFLAGINKFRRAIDMAEATGIPLKDAYKLVDEGDTERHQKDVWDNPLSNNVRDTAERREANRRSIEDRRQEGNTVFGIVFQFVTSKYMLILIAVTLTIKAVWPTVKTLL
jgi:hypothetical protein